jgi:2-dehydro-3-deoxyphosphooctonate aldolase (KDO 8-P synthase)
LNKLPEVLSVLMKLDEVAKANPVRLDMFDA